MQTFINQYHVFLELENAVALFASLLHWRLYFLRSAARFMSVEISLTMQILADLVPTHNFYDQLAKLKEKWISQSCVTSRSCYLLSLGQGLLEQQIDCCSTFPDDPPVTRQPCKLSGHAGCIASGRALLKVDGM